MRMLQGWLARLLGMFRKDDLGQQVAEEMQSHIEMEIADRVRGGQAEETARREVLMRFHGVDATKERYREQGGVPALEHFIQDIRYALRAFARSQHSRLRRQPCSRWALSLRSPSLRLLMRP